jgi:hypothetical protein
MLRPPQQAERSKKMKNTIPHHVEARALGADIVAIKNLRGNSAAEIRAVWDYRTAGLTADQAREYIAKWTRESYHPRAYVPQPGRYVGLQRQVKTARQQYADFLSQPWADTAPTWQQPIVSWMAAGSTIVTERKEHVVWGDHYKPGRYPEGKTVTYTSYLLRTDMPHAREFIAAGMGCAYASLKTFLRIASTKSMSHTLRGNWRATVARELLGVEYPPAPGRGYKKVAVVDGEYYSVYDGSKYVPGVERIDIAKPNHGGGLYYYRTAEKAQNAEFPGISALADAEKTVVPVQVAGRKIRYGNGKIAASRLTVMAN